jgi:CRISPR/Cas system-associated exonuclease Cas4 (RecB family)
MGWQDSERTTTSSEFVISNRAKVAAAAAKRRDKIASLKTQTSSGWVKDRVTKKGHPLIEELRQYMIDAVDTRNKPRDTEHIHPSEISKSDWCPRQTYYRISGVPHDKGYEAGRLYWRLASIYEEGHEIHAKHQTCFWEMGTLEGAWSCMRCEHYWWAVAPAVCPECASWHIEYREVPIVNEVAHIIGHTDGLHNEHGVRRNLEMKSVGVRSIEIEIPGVYLRWKESGGTLEGLWGQIKIPFPSHQRQVQIYMDTLNLMGYEVNETVFIYEFKANQDLKGFTVKYDPVKAGKLIARAEAVVAARDTGIPPDRPERLTVTSKTCKECPWRTECWSIDAVQVGQTQEA